MHTVAYAFYRGPRSPVPTECRGEASSEQDGALRHGAPSRREKGEVVRSTVGPAGSAPGLPRNPPASLEGIPARLVRTFPPVERSSFDRHGIRFLDHED